MQSSMKDYKQGIILFLTGMIAFSSLCSYITVKLFHLPCVIEVFLLILIYYYRKDIHFTTNQVVGIFAFVFFGTIIGLLNPKFELTDILPIARCFLLGAIGFVYARNNNIFRNIDALYVFCFGVFIGDIINGFLLIKANIIMGDDKQYAVDINIILSVLWAVMTILYKKWYYLFLMCILVPILCFVSISRGVATFFLIGISLAFLTKIIHQPSKIILISAMAVISFMALTTLYTENEEAVRNFSPSMHFRLYTKMKNYGGNSADGNRLFPYKWAVDNMSYYAFPRGFLGKKFLVPLDGDNTPLMSPWDSAYMEIIYTAGLPVFLFLIFFFLRKLVICLKMYQYTKETIFSMTFIMLALLFFEYIFTYGLIRSPFTVFCNGAFLGFVIRLTAQPEIFYGNLIPCDNVEN